MFVKKFEAASMEQALSQIRAEFGPDALVLSSQTKSGKLFQKSFVEVTAARLKDAAAKKAGAEEISEEDLMRVFPHRRLTPVKEAVVETKRVVSPSIEMDKIDKALGEIRLFERDFIRQGFSEKSASDLAKRLKYEFARDDLNRPDLMDRAKISLISSGLRVLTPDFLDAHPKFAVVGLPGVGKTATVVKLGLSQKLAGKKVALGSLDVRKLLGKKELQTYAKALKLQFGVRKMDGIKQATTEVNDTSAVPVHSLDLSEKFLRGLAGTSVILVVDATMRALESIRFIEFVQNHLKVGALAFTKLDLISQPGAIYEVLRSTKLPCLGASLGPSFKTPFKFFQPQELGLFLIKQRGVFA